MIECPDCRATVSTSADKCPKCGRRMRFLSHTDRREAFLFLVVIALIFFGAIVLWLSG